MVEDPGQWFTGALRRRVRHRSHLQVPVLRVTPKRHPPLAPGLVRQERDAEHRLLAIRPGGQGDRHAHAFGDAIPGDTVTGT